MIKTLRFFKVLVTSSIRASISMRGAFIVESCLMIGNNLIFLMLWWIFFRKFKSVGTWTFQEMIALMTVISGGYGLLKICFGGMRDIARAIATGNLDPFLTQPKNLLLHLLGIRSYSKGWGHILTALILVLIGGGELLLKLPLVILFMICGCLTFGSIGVIAHSSAFWFGSTEAVSNKYLDSVLLFVYYPVNIYSGAAQIVMYTIFPAGIIGYLPVELIREFRWSTFFILISSVCVFVSLALLVFHRGLRRYESGNQFGFRF